ncbi:sigma-70 RNA polymerase sigma factor region 4 domain-containing protein [Nonomuraea turcica]|uniref:hypothetical protein n=1 Tax=Nonomuraea sp. G32 TaxID=3067274 RepID=UPI00273C99F3|nr:hypothetical protein [Nonomuraea sp. G32]MDP4510346.1 hypothetical protein [Nonomuraea sp. G32]
MKITTRSERGDEQSFTIAYSRGTDDPSSALATLIASGGLERLLHELGNQESIDHLPESAAEMEATLHVVRDALDDLETRRRLLMTAARTRFRQDFPLRDLAEHAGLATMTARRRLEEDRGRWPGLGRTEDTTEDNEVQVLLTIGDQAELVTSQHPASAPLRIPAARIAEQAGLPANELPGRRFTVDRLTSTDADGFALVHDPRR